MLKNLSLTLKLSLLPAVALLGLLLFVIYTSVQLAANDARLDTLENNSFPTLEKADAVNFQFSRLPGMLNSAVAAGELATLDEARKVLADIADLQQALQPLTRANQARAGELDDWRQAIARYADNALSASEQLIKGSAGFDDLRPSLDRMASDLEAAQKLGSTFRANAYEDFQSTLGQARTDNATTTRTGYILSAVLVTLVGLGALLIIRGIMGNVHGVIESLQAIARGDGDLTRRVNVDSRDETGEMIQLFNGFLDKLQGTIRQIIEAAGPLGGMSQELYRLTQESKENSRSQQGHTDSIGRDIQTMTSSIQEVAQRSQQASEGAGAASRQADTARASIGSLSTSISDLGSSVLGAVQAMQQLEEETQQVGSVLTVIRSIAEQTNLLALNAAIEAARAGEQGRGFAVVADEVRNLAQKTAASTAEIQQIIQRLQNSANGVLNVMTANGDKAQHSIERSVEATRMLESIAVAVGQIDQLNAGIAQLTQEQIGLSSSIQQDTQVLQQDAQATAHGAEATARLGEQLVSTGDHLRAATAQFRV
ncbi:methyl-accepting chemotaxis protein [Aquipseudomonas alcaligenes]|uniref:Methyl-accepting chemotaxis protein n=1 Tax=Aquipseudomonas alcaligenes (strain ATCC 14909 / DSM 50342 / CCUG 1425 / JCM 20561 / NBRC 14159 / NCIMB 9945 / NCTC 10367 / 1577) TaxID=1215092 RepID=U3B1L3_AQUA1|nr:methyl-accepting chemotaxis protein [Pseudomonas alcaligenes]GAD60813.1 putative methyl-accepting chemotaxis protein [Pseudomonas alcaligenes NBRC 14159]SUD13668.1 methyl-accepting chemotaxis transducer [Pseudomonas alcaligenes]